MEIPVTSMPVHYSLTLWMTLMLLVLVAEAFWVQRISIPLLMGGLLPPVMLLAVSRQSHPFPRHTRRISRRRS